MVHSSSVVGCLLKKHEVFSQVRRQMSKTCKMPELARLCGVAKSCRTHVSPWGSAFFAYSGDASAKSWGVTLHWIRGPLVFPPSQPWNLCIVCATTCWVLWHHFKYKLIPNRNMSFPFLLLEISLPQINDNQLEALSTLKLSGFRASLSCIILWGNFKSWESFKLHSFGHLAYIF